MSRPNKEETDMANTTKAGGKDSLTKKGGEAEKHLKTSKPKISPAKKPTKSADNK
jgi:hypothetical protein